LSSNASRIPLTHHPWGVEGGTLVETAANDASVRSVGEPDHGPGRPNPAIRLQMVIQVTAGGVDPV